MINKSDVFVYLDNVQEIMATKQNTSNEYFWLTIPVKVKANIIN